MAFLIDDILLAPILLANWLGENLKDAAEKELTDEARIQEEILELQMCFEIGEISEEEYQRKEAKLMKRLQWAREYKKSGEGRGEQ